MGGLWTSGNAVADRVRIIDGERRGILDAFRLVAEVVSKEYVAWCDPGEVIDLDEDGILAEGTAAVLVVTGNWNGDEDVKLGFESAERLSLRLGKPSAVLCDLFRETGGRVVDAVEISGDEEESPEGEAELIGMVGFGRSRESSDTDGIEMSGGPLVERTSL